MVTVVVYIFFLGHLWLWTCPLPVSRFTTDIVGSIQIIWPWNICISATLFRLLAHQTLFSILIHFSEQAGTCSLRWVRSISPTLYKRLLFVYTYFWLEIAKRVPFTAGKWICIGLLGLLNCLI